jgi:hypothetical protein
VRQTLTVLVVGVFATVACVMPLGESTTISQARLSDSSLGRLSVATDTLDPPTSLVASGGARATLSWTPTVDAYATGYAVLRTTTSGGSYTQVATATPATTSTFADTPSVDGTYYYVLRSYIQNWTSVPTNQVSATVAVGNTGLKPCTAQAADTGGDGNGYELNPTNGCAADGLVATDVNSGTTTNTTCTNTGKDRHRFSSFTLGLPGSVTSISGITVKATAGIDAVAGTNRICAQVSWNAGSSWTATEQVIVTGTGQTTYTFGGSTYLWGRTWAVGQFTDPNFQVRLIDVSSVTTRDFAIDTVQVQVNYTP